MGIFRRISRGFGFIKQAYAMAFQDKTLMMPSLLLVGSTIAYIVVWVVGLHVAKVDLEGNAAYVLGAICTFGSFLIFYFFMGMTVHLVDKHLAGEELSLSAAFSDAMQNFLAIVVLALISTVIELVGQAARKAASDDGGVPAMIGSLVVSVIEAIWTIASFLLLPIIIIEDAAFGDSLKRASAIHKGNLLQIGIGEVGVRIAASLVTLLVIFPLFFGVFAMAGTIGIIPALVIGGVVFSLLAAFQVFVRMAYYTCLYHWAVAVEREGSSAPAPAPLAAALA